MVDSSSPLALTVIGSDSIKAASIEVVGGDVIVGNATLSPKPVTNAAYVPDPLAGLPTPSTSGVPKNGSINLAGNTKETINPGIYSQISVSGNAVLTMNAGTYIIEGGGIQVSGNASVTGNGVTLYNTGSKFPSSGGTFGAITLSGNGTTLLSPPTNGPYTGILIFQPAANTNALTLIGNVMLGVSGMIYALRRTHRGG